MSARWMSRNVARVCAMRSLSSPSSGKRPPHVLRGDQQLADLLELVAVPVRAVVAGVQRQAEHADRVLLPRPEQRRRHREVLVDARERHRLRERVDALSAPTARAAARRSRSDWRCPRALRAPAPRPAARAVRCAARSAATPAAGRTDSPRRRRPARARRAGRGRAGRSGSRPTCRRRRRPCRRAGRRARRGRRCRRARRSAARRGSGRRPARGRPRSAAGPRPPWIRIGTLRSAASSKTGERRSSFSRNFCARGWSLIPRAPRSRQRVASSIGSSARSRRTNGISRPVRALGERERPVVAGPEARDAGPARRGRT